MSNCIEIIKRGKNKGRICGEVSGHRCLHASIVCHLCGEGFRRKDMYSRHKALHREEEEEAEEEAEDTVEESEAVDRVDRVDRVELEDVKLRLKSKDSRQMVSKTSFEALQSQLDIITGELMALRKEMNAGTSVSASVHCNGTVNVGTTHNNIQNINLHIGDDFFKELVDKCGREGAMKTIIGAARANDPLLIIDALYLSVPPNERPIASWGKQFRFMDSKRQIVHDQDGSKISKHVGNGLQNAFLMASCELIDKQVKQDTEMTDDEMENFMAIQTCGCAPPRTDQLVTGLSSRTQNTAHPFWGQTVQV